MVLVLVIFFLFKREDVRDRGVQANAKESAQRLVEDGATMVCASLGEARIAAEHLLVKSQNIFASALERHKTEVVEADRIEAVGSSV